MGKRSKDDVRKEFTDVASDWTAADRAGDSSSKEQSKRGQRLVNLMNEYQVAEEDSK